MASRSSGASSVSSRAALRWLTVVAGSLSRAEQPSSKRTSARSSRAGGSRRARARQRRAASGAAGAQVVAGGRPELLHRPSVVLGVHLQDVAGRGRRAETGLADGEGGLAVHGDPHRGRNGPVDGGADERVEEVQTAGDVLRCGQDPRLAQPLDGVGHLLGAESGDAGRHVPVGVGAEHGDGPGEAHRGGAEPLQSFDQAAAADGGGQLAQLTGVDVLRFEAAVADPGDEFDGFVRVARGEGPAFAREQFVGALAEHVAHEAG